MSENAVTIIWKEHISAPGRRRFHLVQAREEAAIERAAAQLGIRVVTLDLSTAKSKSELLDVAASAMAFPETSGRNWDALLDLMSDLSWWGEKRYVLTIQGGLPFRDASPDDFSTFLEVLGNVAERLTTYGIEFDVVLIGSVPVFDVETAVGVTNVCDHAAS